MVAKKISVNKGIFPLRDFLSKKGIRRILLVTGKQSFKSIEPLVAPYLKHFEIKKFDDFDNNPQYTEILVGIEIYKRFNPDVVIAIGGGSCIDMAKSINFLAKQTEPLLEIIQGKSENIKHSYTPLVVLPTTAGTGSEATSFSVIYVGKLKYSLAHPDILPDYVLADSSLVVSVPKYVAGCSGFDAFTQALESYWSKNSTPESDEFALYAIKLIIENIECSINKPSKKRFENMVEGSFYSGKAINITKTTLPHALSYTLTSHFGIPHGHAVAKIFAPTLEHTYRFANNETKRKIETILNFFQVSDVKAFTKKWLYLMEVCYLRDELIKCKLTNYNTELIVSNVNLQRASGHPVNFSKRELTDIVDSLFNDYYF